MNCFRFSGSWSLETCSAETVVPADDEDVHAGGHDGLVVLLGALRGERAGDGHAGGPDFGQAGRNQFRLDGCLVELLHPPGDGGAVGLVLQRSDLVEHGLRVLVPRPEPLQVQHAESAEAAQGNGGLGRHGRVHGRGDNRHVELVGIYLPRDRNVLGITRPTVGDDRDVIQGVGTTPTLATANLNLISHVTTLLDHAGYGGATPPSPPGN